jgi:hypothetical protein
MFEEILPVKALATIAALSLRLKDFYLAGGTGLALQLGHRKSADFDFFSTTVFSTDLLVSDLLPDKIETVREGTLHCEKSNLKLSFLYYGQPLIYPVISWRDIKIADWRDIAAEKMKAVAQRGSKKDFYDLYALLKIKLSIEDLCRLFTTRFAKSQINLYHVLKSMVYFDDADQDPPPVLVGESQAWSWDEVKKFFTQNIREFEKNLLA